MKQRLGLWTLVSIGVGSMIASGIYAMPAAMAAVAGPSLILAGILAGIIVIFQALPYAELGSTFHLEGGPYAFPRLAMGNSTGFLIGWSYFVNAFIGTAAIIDIFVVYLGFYIPDLSVGNTLTPLGIAIAVIVLWVFTIINILGVKWGGLYSIITTIGKLIALLIFVVVGFFYFKGGNFSPFFTYGFTGLSLAIPLFYWSYTGFETIVVPTGEVKNPSKTIPLAMIIAVIIAISTYFIVMVVFTGMISWEGLNIGFKNWKSFSSLSSPLADVSKGLGLFSLAAIVTIGAMVATGGAGGNWVLIQGRMPYAMAKDKLFWKLLGKTNSRFDTPANSLIFSSILTTIIMITIPNFPSVALIASFTAVFSYGSAILSVLILRKTKPNVKRSFKLPVARTFCVTGFILSTWLIYWASWPWTLVGSVFIIAGYLFYALLKGKKEWRRSFWVPIYLFGISLVSFIGDPTFSYNNILEISPLGIIKTPYDLVVLAIFAMIMFYIIYKKNTDNYELKN